VVVVQSSPREADVVEVWRQCKRIPATLIRVIERQARPSAGVKRRNRDLYCCRGLHRAVVIQAYA